MQRASSSAELVGVHGGDARDQAIGRRVPDEVIELASAALGGDRQRSVFDERALIDQLRDVFPRRALIGLAPALDRGGTVLVERDGVAGDEIGKIGADMVEIDGGFLFHLVALDLGGLEKQNRLAVHQGRAARGGDLRDLAAVRSCHQVLHLHRFEDGDLLPRTHQIPFRDLDGDDGALQGRRHRHRSGRTGGGLSGLGRWSRFAGSVRGREEQRPCDFLCGADQRGDMGIDEVGGNTVGGKIRMRQHRLDERDVGGDTSDAEFAQGARRLLHHIGPARGRRMDDHLGQQGVEGRTGPVPGIPKSIDAHARAGRRIEHRQRTAGRLRRALLVHHFHVDAKLHGKAAWRRNGRLRQAERGQGSAGGDCELRLHEIDTQHLFGHGMLDLKPRIGLDEGERRIADGCLAIDQEFEGAEIVVVRRGCKRLCGIDDAGAQAIAQRGARCDFDQLLVTSLDRAFTFPQMADRPVVIADDLHLDVACLADQALDIDVGISEGGLRLGLAARIGFLQLRGVLDEPHAAAAAAGHRLDHDRPTGAERGKECLGLVQRGRAGGAFDHGQAAALGEPLGFDLVAEQIERFGGRPDEDDPLLCATARQQRILAEKTIAGVQRVAIRSLRRRDHRFDIEIGARAPSRNFVGFVGGPDVQRQRVVRRVDGDGGKAGFAGGTGDTNGDFAAIGDQQSMKGHGCFRLKLSDPSWSDRARCAGIRPAR